MTLASSLNQLYLARFRIKKKNKTVTLERSVSNLTGRAEELEREAADLRRENGWLKEIVMLKGSRYAATRGQASSQTPTLAAGEPEAGEDVESDVSSDEEEKVVKKKNKGKARAKSKKP